MIVRVQSSWEGTQLIILRQSISMFSIIFVRYMVEEKKVFLVKVDTLDNVANSITKHVSTKKFSWCKESMGIFALDC